MRSLIVSLRSAIANDWKLTRMRAARRVNFLLDLGYYLRAGHGFFSAIQLAHDTVYH